jgi:DNA-directed RNA polymerase sigma subunit (sigma70/sigma32)
VGHLDASMTSQQRWTSLSLERPAMTPRQMETRDIHPSSPLQIYLQDINDTPLLSAEEERELAERVAEGDPYAREHMVKANLRLVVNMGAGTLMSPQMGIAQRQ